LSKLSGDGGRLESVQLGISIFAVDTLGLGDQTTDTSGEVERAESETVNSAVAGGWGDTSLSVPGWCVNGDGVNMTGDKSEIDGVWLGGTFSSTALCDTLA